MLLIKGISFDAAFNLASEEYLIDNFDDDIFYLWRNQNAVIVGKNQNTASEIDTEFVRKNNISVIRRLTGGGAVFHDLGNLNYSVIGKNEENSFGNYAEFSALVVGYLKTLGINAALSGRNDILADDKKISGNAQCVRGKRMMHHGTLLYSADMSKLSGALAVKPQKYQNRGIASVRSRVANIADLIQNAPSIEIFAENLAEYAKKTAQNVTEYSFTEQDIKAIEKLRDEKYSTWEWNYGAAPSYDFSGSGRTAGGTVDITFSVSDGIMSQVSVSGDFFGIKDVSGLNAKLVGVRHEEGAIVKALYDAPLSDYMSNSTPEEVAKLFF